MKNRYTLLTTLILSMALLPAAKAAEKAKTPETMPLPERQRWAATMLERLDRANRVILDPPYVTQQRERFEELATPFVIGKLNEKDAREAVQTLRDEVTKSERIAIEHLDLRFRRTMARRLTSQSELKLRYRWLKAWENTVQAWQKSADRIDRLDQVLQWLQKSCKTIEAQNYTAFTPVPSFQDIAPPKKTPKPADAEDWSLTAEDVAREEAAKQRAKEKELSKPKPEPERPPLDINLSELSARITGNNLALRRLEAEIVAAGTWDAKRIAPFVTRLKKLAIHMEDTRLFYRLLSPSQQAQVKKVADPAAAIKTLHSKIQAARVAILDKQRGSTSLTNEQRTQLQHLDQLSEELDSIDGNKK